mmetsp:Transcript_14208/g.33033  ORF Transcript_14208/g.33033 Transcript_14208/m.33033 type:complete len:200 (-) Transcript_14208:311-910(-)
MRSPSPRTTSTPRGSCQPATRTTRRAAGTETSSRSPPTCRARRTARSPPFRSCSTMPGTWCRTSGPWPRRATSSRSWTTLSPPLPSMASRRSRSTSSRRAGAGTPRRASSPLRTTWRRCTPLSTCSPTACTVRAAGSPSPPGATPWRSATTVSRSTSSARTSTFRNVGTGRTTSRRATAAASQAGSSRRASARPRPTAS